MLESDGTEIEDDDILVDFAKQKNETVVLNIVKEDYLHVEPENNKNLTNASTLPSTNKECNWINYIFHFSSLVNIVNPTQHEIFHRNITWIISGNISWNVYVI